MAFNFKEEQEIFGLKVDDTAKAYLLETMRWTKFAGIIFSILITLVCMVMAFLMLVYMPVYMPSPVPNATTTLVFMIVFMVGINFYPIFALLRFSSLINKAIAGNNQQQLNHALKYLKNLFRYIGIFTIIFIVLYGLGMGVSFMNNGG